MGSQPFRPARALHPQHLDAGERLRLKFENPLGVAARLLKQYSEQIDLRQEVLKGDFHTLDVIDEQLEAYQVDMRRDFKYQSSRVDNVLYEMAERGDRFFDEMLRIGRIFDLVNGEKVRAEFERQVVADTSQQIERHVSDLIDWMVERDYRQWHDVIDYLNRRATQHAEQMVGQVGSEFEFNRQNMLASVGRDAQRGSKAMTAKRNRGKLARRCSGPSSRPQLCRSARWGWARSWWPCSRPPCWTLPAFSAPAPSPLWGQTCVPYRRSKIKLNLRDNINDLRAS